MVTWPISFVWFLQLLANLLIHTPALSVRCELLRSRRSSKASLLELVFATLKTSLTTLASASDVGDAFVTGFFGHLLSSHIHVRPLSENFENLSGSPLLERSVGFSFFGTFLHRISEYSWILAILLATNCWPLPLVQCRTTVLFIHPHARGVGTLSNAFLTYVSKFVAICAATSWRRGVVNLVLAKRLLAATNLWVFPGRRWTTA